MVPQRFAPINKAPSLCIVVASASPPFVGSLQEEERGTTELICVVGNRHNSSEKGDGHLILVSLNAGAPPFLLRLGQGVRVV